MRRYGLSESRLKRIIRYPKRVEESIVPGLIAAMQPAGTKKYQELWVMYKIENSNVKAKMSKPQMRGKQIKIITAWRYPGKSPERDPVPQEILNEIKNAIT